MKVNKIRRVTRAGGLVETNSSSSHALCICGKESTYAKPGDPEFDLTIQDKVLFIPIRHDCFGWEWEKSNSCLTKLQYVCALFFNSYQPLSSQKKPHKLEKILKDFLGVDKVVFEWEEKYLEEIKNGENSDLLCPSIDHNSYSDVMEEILESRGTIIDFIFNKNSWLYGGNDNSTEPKGYYKEMKTDDFEPNGTITLDFSPGIGKVDFRVDLFSQDWYPNGFPGFPPKIEKKIEQTEDKDIFESILYRDGEFTISNRWEADCLTPLFAYLNEEENKLYLVYIQESKMGPITDKLIKLCGEEGKGTQDIMNTIPKDELIMIPVSVVSDEFGELYA